MPDATWDDTYAPAGDSRVDADLVSAGKRDWSGAARRYRRRPLGSLRLNYALHIAALVQIRFPGPGQNYYARKRAEGKKPLEAMRCLKRRLSDVVFSRPSARPTEEARGGGPGRTLGGDSSIQRV